MGGSGREAGPITRFRRPEVLEIVDIAEP